MRKSIQAGIGLLALGVASAAPLAAQTATPWLHVRVEEARDASKVSVNLPLSVVEAVLKASPEMIERHGRIHLGGHHGMQLEDLRRVWKELAAVGDAELVSVESEDENVKVQRKGDLVEVLVDHKPRVDREGKEGKEGKDAKDAKQGPTESRKARGAEQVHVEIPVSLVDALLSGEGDEPNIEAAVSELRKLRGDIVRVHDDDSHVRVWVDEQNTQPAAGK
jgi:hypothetical protein